MALWICRGCTAAYSVGAPACPQCGSTDHTEEGQDDMPKITVAGGPSIAGVTATWGEDDAPDTEGSEQPSASTSSSTSSPKPSATPETNESAPSKRVRKTASRSAQAPTDSSTAPSTGGDPTGPTSATGSDGKD